MADQQREQVGDLIAQRILTSEEGQAWVRIQQKTFTRWCNTFLSERLMEIKDLQTDFGNGVYFINLLEEISDKTVAKRYNKNPTIRAQKLENLSFCFNFLKQENIKLVGVGPEDVADANLKLILGLIWTLILRFQINRGEGGSAKNALLEWVRSKIPEYNIKNFTSDWQSGKAIYALANAVEPGVLPEPMTDSPIDNTTRAFNAAHEKMQIPQILDPQDMVENPDEHSNMTYISYFRDYLDRCKQREEEERLKRIAVASKCKAYGPGLEGAECFIPAPFTIEAINAKGTRCPCGGHPFVVKIKSPKGENIEATIKDNQNGLYDVEYTAVDQGIHNISITLEDKHLPGSAFKVFAKPAVADATKSLAYGPGLERAEQGKDAPFTVELRNRNGDKIPAAGAPLKVEVKGPFGDVDVQKKDNGDGTFSVSYKPLDVGEHVVNITLDGAPVANSPYKVISDAADGTANYQNTYAEGPGLEDGNTTAEPTHYTIYTVDKNGNKVKTGGSPIEATIIGPNGDLVDADLKDNNDGTYTVKYHPTEPGKYTVENILRNPFRPIHYEHIKNSPKTVNVEPGTDPSKSHAYGPGVEGGILDTLPTHFTIQAADRNGEKMKEGGDDFEVKIKDAKGNDVPFDLKDNNDGTYDVKYKPNGPGNHKVDVNLRGKPIKDAPFNVGIRAGASAGHSVVENFNFTVQAKTAAGENRTEGGEDFQVKITGPQGPVSTVELKDGNDGKYHVSYKLPSKGEYQISVTVNGEDISGSPWKQVN